MDQRNLSGIYQIRNLIDSKLYVGSAINFEKRWFEHRRKLIYGTHTNKHLQAAWNKYKQENFLFEILEICEKNKLIEREQHWLDLTKCYNRKMGYNSRVTADNMQGFKHSDESKLKMSTTRKEKFKDENFKNKVIDKIRGRKASKEALMNMRNAQKGKKRSEETRMKIKEVWRIRKEKQLIELLGEPIKWM